MRLRIHCNASHSRQKLREAVELRAALAAKDFQRDTLSLLGGQHAGGCADEDDIASLVGRIDPSHLVDKQFVDPFGGEAENAREITLMLQDVIRSGCAGGVDNFFRQLDAHAIKASGASLLAAMDTFGV